jgi:cell division protein FtsN
MNRIIFLSIVSIVLLLSSCKTVKQPAQSPYTTEPGTQPKVFSVPTSSTQTVTEEPKQETAAITSEKPISVRKEQVSFTEQSDRSTNANNSYFVIIGSFSQLENAKNFRQTAISEGFTPIILHSETGYYRVCVNSYKNENDARGRISQVRQAFPKYSDVWLLVKE